MKISVVIIVKDGAKTIKRTLDSLESFNDIIVYDNGSTDKTLDIVESYKNVNLIKGDFFGFGPTKNKAASYAKNDWILILDSDEVIDQVLLENLKKIKLDINTVYMLNFNAYYKNTQVKYCGWSGQKIKRIYNKKFTKFNDNMVHENIIDKGFKIDYIKGNVEHYSYSSISQFIVKLDRYSTLFAEENKGKRKSSPLQAFFNALYSFFKSYIIKKGFLDGYIGLIVSVSHATNNFFKYIKLYELNKELKK